jgi:uncharacterized protein DUF4339
MSQGNDFANYSAAAATGADGSDDVWFVAVASDDIKQMSVDQLDEAFRLGVITADTAVWTEGMEAWAPLGQVADLESDSETSGAVPVANPPSHGGHFSHDEPARASLGDGPLGNSGLGNSGLGNGGLGAGGFGAVTLQSVQYSTAPGPNSISPVTASYAPSAYPGSSNGLSNGPGNGPVALNVDEEMPVMRHGRRFRPERWALAAAALVAIGVVGYNNLFSSSVAAAGPQANGSQAAGSSAKSPTLAARPYDGVEPGEKLNAEASAKEEAPAPTAADTSDHAAAGSAAAAAVKPIADDSEEPPASKSKASDKESLKGNFSKAFNKKATASKPAKVKPRKASTRATTKARATKSKKPGVVREKSAFDPLNDSLP